MPDRPPDSIGPGAPIWDRGGRSAEEHANAIEKVIRAQKRYIATHKSTAAITRTHELALKRLQLMMVKLRGEQSQFTKSATALATKIQSSGGISGALTRFTGSLITLGSSVDKNTGLMKIFGGATAMTAGKFNAYVAVLQVAVGIYTKFLDVQDKARIKQAGLIKQFGALNNISITAPYKAAAKGLEIAGSTGEKAAERLFSAVTRMRSAGEPGKFLGEFPLSPEAELGEGNKTPFEKLVTLTTGGLSGAPEYLLKLREVFARRPTKDLVRDLEDIATVARDSGVPIEQFVGEVFALGEAFVAVGADTTDAVRLIGMFGEAVGKLGLPMQMVVDFARQTEQQLKLAQGVPSMLTAVHFIDQTFNKFPERLQKEIQGMTSRMFAGKKFGELSILDQATIFQQFDTEKRPQIFQEARLRATYETVKGFNLPIVGKRAITPAIGNVEYGPLMALYKILEEQGPDALADNIKKMREGKKVAIGVKESVTRALDEFEIFTNTVAALQKEFTANFKAMWKSLSGWMVANLRSSYPGAQRFSPKTMAEIRMGTLQTSRISKAVTEKGFTKPEEVFEFLTEDPIWKQRLVDYGELMLQSDFINRLSKIIPIQEGMYLEDFKKIVDPNEMTIDAGPDLGQIKLTAEFIRSLGTPTGKGVGSTLSAEKRRQFSDPTLR